MLKYFKLIKISEATLTYLLWKMSLMFFGLISTILIGYCLSQSYQGYYYTFLSLVGLKVFAELGLSTVITTFIAHENVRIEQKLLKENIRLQRVSMIAQFSLKWFFYAGILFVILLSLGGYIFFSISHVDTAKIFWKAPWFSLVFFTGINLFILPFWSILEGLGEAKNVYYYRCMQVIFSSTFFCIALFNGADLWSQVIGSAVEFCCGVLILYVKYYTYFVRILSLKSKPSIFCWTKEIFPMQWRISLSWLGGYLSFSSIVPIVFYYKGENSAGQLGMTLIFMSAMNSFCSAWIVPKLPIFSKLISQGRVKILKDTYFSTLREVAIVSFILSVCLLFVAYILFKFNLQFSQRLVNLESILFFVIATFFLNLSIPMAFYLRAYKEEPLLKISVFSGLLLFFLNIISCIYLNLSYLSIFYLFVILIQTTYIYAKWQKKFNELYPLRAAGYKPI